MEPGGPRLPGRLRRCRAGLRPDHRRGGRQVHRRQAGRVHGRGRRRSSSSARRRCSPPRTSTSSTSESSSRRRRRSVPVRRRSTSETPCPRLLHPPGPAGPAGRSTASGTRPSGRTCCTHCATPAGATTSSSCAPTACSSATSRPTTCAAAQAAMAATEVNARWQAEMAPFFTDLDRPARRRDARTRPGLRPRRPARGRRRAHHAQETDRDRTRARALEALAAQTIELPSWAFGNSGTRFKVFGQPGVRARPVREARGRRPGAQVHRPRAAGLPAHPVGQGRRLRQARRARRRPRRRASGRSTRTCSRTTTTGSARSPTRTRPSGARRSTTTPSASRSCGTTGSTDLKIWLPDGTNYPGQDDLRARQDRLADSLQQIYAMLDPEHRILLEYKFFEPYFYAMDIPDWGTSLVHCLALGDQATVVLDTGHHAPGTNIEFIVHAAAAAGPARRVRLQLAQLRRRRPDRRLGRPVPAVPDHERDRVRRRPRARRRASTSCSTSATTSSRRSPARSGR